MLELEWVMRSCYGIPVDKRVEVIARLLDIDSIHVQHSSAIHFAINGMRNGLDFADCLHAALSDEATEFVTFDQAFTKGARDWEGITVRNLGA